MASTPYAVSASVGGPDFYEVTVPVFACSDLANALEFEITPGHNFEVISIDFNCVTPITTGAKTCTLTPTIGSTAIPGTVTALAGTKAKASVTNIFTASSTKLYGGAADALKLTGSATTAFVEGTGYFVVRMRSVGNNA